MAAFATEVKVDTENGFGTWKVKLKVNISLFCVLPREGRKSREEKRAGGRCGCRKKRKNADKDAKKMRKNVNAGKGPKKG